MPGTTDCWAGLLSLAVTKAVMRPVKQCSNLLFGGLKLAFVEIEAPSVSSRPVKVSVAYSGAEFVLQPMEL